MSESGKIRDAFPQYKSFGASNEMLLRNKVSDSLVNAKYGYDTKNDPDSNYVPPTRFGKIESSNGAASDCIHPNEPPLVSYYKEKKEAIYKREPVGHSAKHTNFINNHAKGDSVFGIKTDYSESAKNILYPIDRYDQNEMEKERNELYKLSHQAWEAGEQVNRNYVWDKTPIRDPTHFRFGKVLEPEVDGAKKTVSTYYQAPTAGQLVHDEPVPNEDPLDGKVFGMTNKPDEWGSIDCIRGYGYGVDHNIDKGMRAPFLPGTEHMTFGIQNKKDIGATETLSYRTTVEERDKPLPKDELKEYVTLIVEEEGVDFELVYEYATEQCGGANMSINQFLDIFRQLYLS
ncbi:predicted protein [Naegleria gruberi]|uniref:Predicted protein n=1 Tax=Naegleria gruberi TaxID=5762 RepID=D2UYA2_NAEGR|nr:uncharacterized protein NAEGRDRAFT_61401 [Naegleria gruberi]EFC50761.1 predicted protein [Naegleria gruberi]|eukprot:XP_002683505.1 predicted protein [Naegleria gruberi strain NEG-M]